MDSRKAAPMPATRTVAKTSMASLALSYDLPGQVRRVDEDAALLVTDHDEDPVEGVLLHVLRGEVVLGAHALGGAGGPDARGVLHVGEEGFPEQEEEGEPEQEQDRPYHK